MMALRVVAPLTHPINADPQLKHEGFATTTGALVDDIACESGEPRCCYALLVKIVVNVISNPLSSKFREVNKTNAQVMRYIRDVPPCRKLLLRLGFKDQVDHFRLQTSGVRGPEVARLQAALYEYPEFHDLVEDLAPAVEACNLSWCHEGTEYLVPWWAVGAPKSTAGMKELAEREEEELRQALLISSPNGVGLGAGAACEEDELRQALLLSSTVGAGAAAGAFSSVACAALAAAGDETGDADLQRALLLSQQEASGVVTAAAAEVAAAAAATAEDDDEDDPDLQEALRLSMAAPP